MKKGFIPALLATTSVSMFNAPAMAQFETVADDGQIAEIVVTAQKRAENLQKVPLSVTAISGNALEARGLNSLEDLGNNLPGLQISSNSGVVLPFLRGVGNRANTLGNEASVAIYVDGVYYARLASGFFSLNNIERVEVLKGPQGTLFGRSSSGGVIQIVTRDPSHDAAVKGSLGYGRFNEVAGNFYVTGSLSANVAADFSVTGQTSDGTGTNRTTGRRTGYEDSFLARSKLLWEPGDNTKMLFTGYYGSSKVSGQGSTYPGTTQGTLTTPYEVFDPSAQGFSFYDVRGELETKHKIENWGISLRAEQDLAFATLTSITAYNLLEETSQSDPDYGPRPNFTAFWNPHVKQFTQELQLGSNGRDPLSWILGGYYYNNSSEYHYFQFRGVPFGPLGIDSFAGQKSESLAGFAQASYEVLPELKLTGGIRYTHDKVRGHGRLELPISPPLVIAPEDSETITLNKVTFRLAADYQVTDRILTYASFSRGYKTPSFNLVTFNPTPNKAETLDAYEIGFKSDLFDRTLRLNAAAFYYDIKNPQVLLFRSTGAFVSNAGGARVYGLEFDGQVALSRSLTGRFGATILDSKYSDYRSAPSALPNTNTDPALGYLGGTGPQTSVDASGNRTPLASKLTFNVGGDYTIDTGHGTLTLTADYSYRSRFAWEPDNFLQQKAYGLLDAQLRYAPSERFAVRVWGKNLTDEKYVVGTGTQAGPAGYPFTPGMPLTYGIAFDFEF